MQRWYVEQAVTIVRSYIEKMLDKSDPPVDFEVYPVWFCRVLQNWKALVSSTLPDQMYYEVTYNGNDRVAYLDVYKKFDNISIVDDGRAIQNVVGGGTRKIEDVTLLGQTFRAPSEVA